MSKVIVASVAILLLLGGSACADDWCNGTGRAAWSKQLRVILPFCNTDIYSPDRQLRLDIDKNGILRIFEREDAKPIAQGAEPVGPSAMASWSPTSEGFFINDGEGSGMTSVLRVYFLHNGRLVESDDVEKASVKFFRDRMKCGSEAEDPNVWGLGWSSDGKMIYFFIQATVNAPCGGHQHPYFGAEADAAQGKITKIYSERETKNKFRSLMPPEYLEYKPGHSP